MSATPPSALEGTQSPSPFEVLWERYRSLIMTIVAALLVALAGNYIWRYYSQKQIDESWSAFVASVGIDETYTDASKAFAALREQLVDIDMATIEAELGKANKAQKPYLLLAVARKAMMAKDWDRASSTLDELEKGFPTHDLVAKSKQPVQGRDPLNLTREEFEELDPEEPRHVEARQGSVVGMMREQIASAQGFALPAKFAQPEIPADAPKVKFTMGDYGSFTVSLMPGVAEAHVKEFLELARSEDGGFWKGIAVDQVVRPNDTRDQPRSLHFGYPATREDDRTKWQFNETSEHEVPFENTGLSHFPGAVAARPGSEGKSAVDRVWISVDDESNQDGNRVVFGYVSEGLDVLREICDDAGLSAQDEENGSGRPTENIRVTAVEVL